MRDTKGQEAPSGMTDDQWRDLKVSIGTYLERIIAERNEVYEARFTTLERVIDERDRLYTAQFKSGEVAVNAALAAQEKAVAAAFLASEKAIVKAEDAQKDYNVRSNEFRGQLDDQAKTLMPRQEASVLFRSVEDKLEASKAGYENRLEATKTSFEKSIDSIGADIASLRESRSEGSGKESTRSSTQVQHNWIIGIAVAVILSIIGTAISIVGMLTRK